MADIWDYCKVIEENEEGKLILLRENLDKVCSFLSKTHGENCKILLFSTMGPRACGKSFITNVIYQYTKSNGKGWTSEMFETETKRFYFGNMSPSNTTGRFVPDEKRSGVYFWPDLLLLPNRDERLWVMHLHVIGGSENLKIHPQCALNKFLLLASSAVADIICQQKAFSLELGGTISDSPEIQKCQHITYLVRSKTKQEKSTDLGVQLATLPPCTSFSITEEMFNKKQISAKHATQLTTAVRNVLDHYKLQAKLHNKTEVTLENIRQFFEEILAFVNLLQNPKPSLGISENDNYYAPNFKLEAVSRNSVNFYVSLMKDAAKPAALPTIEAGDIFKTTNECQQMPGNLKPKYGEAQTLSQVSDAPPTIPNHMLHHEAHCDKAENANKLKSDDVITTVAKFLSHELFWCKLNESCTDWIYKCLDKKTIHELASSFEVIFKKIISVESKIFMNQNNWTNDQRTEFKELAKAEATKDLFKKFQEIQFGIQNFVSRLDALFSRLQYFPETDLATKIKITQNKVLADKENQVICTIISLGCQKLVPYYQNLNEQKRLQIRNLFDKTSATILSFYRKETEKTMKNYKYLHPENFKLVNKVLLKNLRSAFDEVLKTFQESAKHKIIETLDGEFKELERRNMVKLETAQRQITSLITKLKSEYEMEMDIILEQNPNGVEPKDFLQKNNAVQTQMSKMFCKDAAEYLNEKEGMATHLQALKQNLDGSFKLLEEENRANLEQCLQKPDPKPKPKPKSEAKPPRNISPNPSTDSELKFLSPVFLHFAISKLGIAIGNGNDVSIDYFPGLLAVTTKDEWIWGNDVESNSEAKGTLQHQWSLAECFGISRAEDNITISGWSGHIYYNKSQIKVTPDFILGMILSLVKLKIEKENDGEAKEMFIAVPFWFPSFQRQQVRNASKIAGFTATHLVNDNSAAAFFAYATGLHGSKEDTIIVSETSYRVDISYYYFDQKIKKVSMVGHAGDYEYVISHPDSKKWKEYLNYLPGYSLFANLFSHRNSNCGNEDDVAVTTLANLWTRSINSSETNFSSKSKTFAVLICYQTDALKNILLKAVSKSTDSTYHVQNEAVLLGLFEVHKTALKVPTTLQGIIRDGMPFHINIYSPGGRHTAVRKKEDSLNVAKIPKLSCKVAASVGNTYLVYQESGSAKLPAGDLTIRKLSDGHNSIEIDLNITHEGFILLKQVRSFSTGFLSKESKPLKTSDYFWEPFNIKETTLVKYESIVQSIKDASSLSNKLMVAKNKGTQMANHISSAVNAGLGSFDGDLVVTLILKQLKSSLDNLCNHACTLEDAEKEVCLLENIKKIYKID